MESKKLMDAPLCVLSIQNNSGLHFILAMGKCIAFNEDGSWHEPIPWDEKCFLNKTTSLCDSSAIDEFRYYSRALRVHFL